MAFAGFRLSGMMLLNCLPDLFGLVSVMNSQALPISWSGSSISPSLTTCPNLAISNPSELSRIIFVG